jgi:hypothetical protein
MPFVTIGTRCPLPPGWQSAAPPPPPPPPPPPAEPAVTPITLTATGLVWNGNGLYAGFKATAQSVAGAVIVRGGPDNTYPVIHQVDTPVTDTLYLADGVDPEDEQTWIDCASIHATHSGTSQTVDYYVGDPV